MTLSILCVTNNEYAGTDRFIEHFRELADDIDAELVLGLDREKAQAAPFRKLADTFVDLKASTVVEDVMNEAVQHCSGEYILRLDDDETVSPALRMWLKNKVYLDSFGRLFAFPRVYFYGDEKHVIVNQGIYPDLQTRLGLKPLMFGLNYVHAGNPNGTGVVVPYAIEHHKLLVRSLEDRQSIAARYETAKSGAGTNPVWSRYNLPEFVYPELITKEYGNGDYSAR